jgi:hypothetical protein
MCPADAETKFNKNALTGSLCKVLDVFAHVPIYQPPTVRRDQDVVNADVTMQDPSILERLFVSCSHGILD